MPTAEVQGSSDAQCVLVWFLQALRRATRASANPEGAPVPAPPKAERGIGKRSQHLGCGGLSAAFKIDSFHLAC